MSKAFPELLLQDRTKGLLENYMLNPSQGLLIVGPAGSGKTTLAMAIAAQILKLAPGSAVESYPYFVHAYRAKDKQEISIEAVRDVIKRLRLTAPGNEDIRRVVLIEEANSLSIEAQNALLKILEEPNSDTVFILTAPYERSLLPTIISRVQSVQVLTVALEIAHKYHSDSYNLADIENAWLLSQGYAGLMQTLLADEKSNSLRNAINDVKVFLKKDSYQRLLMMNELAKDRTVFLNFLEAIDRVVVVLHRASIQRDSKNQASKLLKSRVLIQQLKVALRANVSPRVAALKLVMDLTI